MPTLFRRDSRGSGHNSVRKRDEMKKFNVYYAIEPTFERGELDFGHEEVTVETLHTTHKFVKQVEAEDLEGVFKMMQDEQCCPNGEVPDIIKSLGLSHTSMSIGDVIEDEDGRFYVLDMTGFSELSIR